MKRYTTGIFPSRFLQLVRACLLAAICLYLHQPVSAQQKDWVVRVARLEIDTAFLQQYRAAVEEHTKAALAAEPGVLTLYAVYEKEHPNRVMVFEIYASQSAYQFHIKTPHFLKYKTSTSKMVKSLELTDVVPIAFGAKPGILEKQQN